MNRRTFVQLLGAGTTLLAQSPAKLNIDAYSRHLQWLRSPDEVAEAVIEMGYDGLDITVRPYPAHVQPDKVTTDLAPFVDTIRKHGLRVDCIALTNVVDAESSNLEQVLQTASQLGIHYYWGLGTYRYEANKPVAAQLEAIKPRLARIAALNARYNVTGLYHTYSGNSVGSSMWDLLSVLRDFDPAHIGIHYDVGHMTNAGGNGTWMVSLRAADRYIRAVSIKDSIFEPITPPPVGGGPFTGAPAPVAGGAGGRGPTPPQAPPAPPAGGPGGRAPAPAAGGPGGRGQAPPQPPTGWRVRQVPLGTGMVDLARLAEVLKEINFSGPVEIQAEYPNGGAENAGEKITLPRAIVLGAMKRDRLVAKAAFSRAGLL